MFFSGKKMMTIQAKVAFEAQESVKEKAPPALNFKVTLERGSDDESLGIILSSPKKARCGEKNRYSPSSDDESDSPRRTFFIVKDVLEEGPIVNWNAKNRNAPDLQVRTGDLITVVNGISENANEMMNQLSGKAVNLTMRRLGEYTGIDAPSNHKKVLGAKYGSNSKTYYSRRWRNNSKLR